MTPANSAEFPLGDSALEELVRSALEEDRAFEDITTLATIPRDARSRARLVGRSPGVLCGVPIGMAAFRLADADLVVEASAEDGSALEPDRLIIRVEGRSQSILAAERVALNFMQRLSGVASLTARYVSAVHGTKARILDTRKTTPGWRLLEKYAVRMGGGMNHRLDLADAVLIKDNHLAAVQGDIAVAVQRAREFAPPGVRVEVECDRIDQVCAAIKARADIIMLDNMSAAQMRECVALVGGRAIVEASGGVNLDTVGAIARTGVDWISVGALTHSAPALDLALDFDE